MKLTLHLYSLYLWEHEWYVRFQKHCNILKCHLLVNMPDCLIFGNLTFHGFLVLCSRGMYWKLISAQSPKHLSPSNGAVTLHAEALQFYFSSVGWHLGSLQFGSFVYKTTISIYIEACVWTSISIFLKNILRHRMTIIWSVEEHLY